MTKWRDESIAASRLLWWCFDFLKATFSFGSIFPLPFWTTYYKLRILFSTFVRKYYLTTNIFKIPHLLAGTVDNFWNLQRPSCSARKKKELFQGVNVSHFWKNHNHEMWFQLVLSMCVLHKTMPKRSRQWICIQQPPLKTAALHLQHERMVQIFYPAQSLGKN